MKLLADATTVFFCVALSLGFLGLSLADCTRYTVLSGADRAQANTDFSNVRCDKHLVPGWYRFQGSAGDMMPEQCIPMLRCGTHSPGWLNGSHPTVAEGVVYSKVCYTHLNDCCWKSNFIRVRNCGDFFVYELQPSPDCFYRYCGNARECKGYRVLSGADRDQGNTDQRNITCDKGNLVPGWYRFVGAAGNMMPDQCVPMWRCGTNAPGWLNGSHPTVAEGIVMRPVCYHWQGDCCYWGNKIFVRNCGTFFVYELQVPPKCQLRYCGNGEDLDFQMFNDSVNPVPEGPAAIKTA